MSAGDVNDVPCCPDCGRPAVMERLLDVLEDGPDDFTPVMELVCAEHAEVPS